MPAQQDQVPESIQLRFRCFKSNAETIRASVGGKDGMNLMFKQGFNEFAELTSQEFAARYTDLKLANLGSTMRAQQFESRLRDEFRQVLKTWPHKVFDNSNWEQIPDHALKI